MGVIITSLDDELSALNPMALKMLGVRFEDVQGKKMKDVDSPLAGELDVYKRQLLNIMGLLDTPTGGSIEVAGTIIESMKDKELAAVRNKKLGFVFQSFHLINSLNVLDNVRCV